MALLRSTRSFEKRRGALHDLAVPAALATDSLAAKVVEQDFVVKGPIAGVFKTYRTAPREIAFPPAWVDLRFAYTPGAAVKIGPEAWTELRQGMKLFVDMKRPFGRTMIPLLVARVDNEREIRFEYLEGSLVLGFDSIRFVADGATATRVTHHAEHRPVGTVARALFPIVHPMVHGGFVRALHGGMKKYIEHLYRTG